MACLHEKGSRIISLYNSKYCFCLLKSTTISQHGVTSFPVANLLQAEIILIKSNFWNILGRKLILGDSDNYLYPDKIILPWLLLKVYSDQCATSATNCLLSDRCFLIYTKIMMSVLHRPSIYWQVRSLSWS